MRIIKFIKNLIKISPAIWRMSKGKELMLVAVTGDELKIVDVSKYEA